MTNFPDHVVKNILSEMDEAERLQSLSNQDLVIEYLKRQGDDDLYIQEMMNRLWAEWDTVEL